MAQVASALRRLPQSTEGNITSRSQRGDTELQDTQVSNENALGTLPRLGTKQPNL